MKRLIYVLLGLLICLALFMLPAAAEDATESEPVTQTQKETTVPAEETTEPADPQEQKEAPPLSPYAPPDWHDYEGTDRAFYLVEDEWEESVMGQYYCWTRNENESREMQARFDRAFRAFYADDPLLVIDNHIVYVQKQGTDAYGKPTGEPYLAVIDFFDSDEAEAETTKLRVPAFVGDLPVKSIFMWRPALFGGTGYAGYSNDTLKSIVIDAPMTGVGDYAFYRFTALKKVTLPETVTVIGDYAFYGCAALKKVTAKGEITQLSDGAFRGCTSLDYRIPASLEKIGPYALAESGIKKAEIPVSASFVSTDNEEPYEVYNVFSNCKALKTLRFVGERENKTSAKRLPESLCPGCTALKTVELPKGEHDITLRADSFRDCTALQTVRNLDSVSVIEGDTFRNCTALCKLTIPASVVYVHEDAFAGCNNLQSLTLESKDTALLEDYEAVAYRGEFHREPLPANFVKNLPKTCTVYVASKDMKRAVKAHGFKGTVIIRVPVSAPKNVKATKQNGKVTVKWSKVKICDGYRVWAYNAKTGKYQKLATVKAGVTSVTVKSNAKKFAVRAYINEGGDVSWSKLNTCTVS